MAALLQKFGEVSLSEFNSETSKSNTQTVTLTNATLKTSKNDLFTIPWMRIQLVNYTTKYKKNNNKITETDKNLSFSEMRLPSMPNPHSWKPNTTYIITHINDIPTRFYARINETCCIYGFAQKERFDYLDLQFDDA
jgi:hypothetical protein